MKNKWKSNSFIHVFATMSILVILTILVAISMYYYIFSIPEPEGLSLASWPNTFTDNFSVWMEYKDGDIQVQAIGLERLSEYGLWLQVIDEKGNEVFCYRKPEDYPVSYSTSELLVLNTKPYENGNTIFANTFNDSGKTWIYMIGFPYAIGKYVLYYNGENITRLSPIARVVMLLSFSFLVLLVLCYGFWLSRKLTKITDGIKNISLRTYQPLKEYGLFSDIYRALNKMDLEIRCSDKVQSETDKARNEWIANITHDLKTPLSPIKGYAELLVEHPACELQNVQKYGSIILKNINHTEKLINDLKLTYQLDSGAIPYNPQKLRLIRYLKELVIDLINDPAFNNRDISFNSDLKELTISIDPELFRRAVQNIIINALVHNPPKTKVIVMVELASKDTVCIFIRDNGIGMNETEQAELFSRYYRGTNTKERPEGSGLGLAIAQQIITLHSGNIIVTSSPGKGSVFTISLPLILR